MRQARHDAGIQSGRIDCSIHADAPAAHPGGDCDLHRRTAHGQLGPLETRLNLSKVKIHEILVPLLLYPALVVRPSRRRQGLRCSPTEDLLVKIRQLFHHGRT